GSRSDRPGLCRGGHRRPGQPAGGSPRGPHRGPRAIGRGPLLAGGRAVQHLPGDGARPARAAARSVQRARGAAHMSRFGRTEALLAISAAALLAFSPLLPKWALFLVTVALAKGLVVLGLLLLMRAGLVSF